MLTTAVAHSFSGAIFGRHADLRSARMIAQSHFRKITVLSEQLLSERRIVLLRVYVLRAAKRSVLYLRTTIALDTPP